MARPDYGIGKRNGKLICEDCASNEVLCSWCRVFKGKDYLLSYYTENKEVAAKYLYEWSHDEEPMRLFQDGRD